MRIIWEKGNIAVCKIGELHYVVAIDRDSGQVKSCMASDAPRGGGQWFAPLSDAGVQYVANGRTRRAAYSAFRRMTAE